MTSLATHRRKRILITIGLLVATASYNPAHGQDLGRLSVDPYATDAPKLYDEEGHYRGKLSSNPYDPESVSNPYGRYGSEHSADSINNSYGVGMKIVAGETKEGGHDDVSPADSPTFLPKSLPALTAPNMVTDPSD